MTWYELIWIIMIPVILIGTFVVSAIADRFGDPDGELAIFLCMVWLIGGLIVATIRSDIEYKQTAQFETVPIYAKLSDSGLDIILDDHRHFHWTDYGLISQWKNGGKFYKTYYYNKENFGIDSSKFELIVK